MFFSKCALLSLLILVMVLDLMLTLLGQPDCYWEDHSSCEESNPIGQLTLSIHPFCFLSLFLLWLFFILFLVMRLPKPFNFIVAASALIGHALGSSCWLSIFSEHVETEIEHWQWQYGYYMSITLIIVICFTLDILKNKTTKSFQLKAERE